MPEDKPASVVVAEVRDAMRVLGNVEAKAITFITNHGDKDKHGHKIHYGPLVEDLMQSIKVVQNALQASLDAIENRTEQGPK